LRESVGESGGDADIEEVMEIVSSGTELDDYCDRGDSRSAVPPFLDAPCCGDRQRR
jgi:hypothetical protein